MNNLHLCSVLQNGKDLSEVCKEQYEFFSKGSSILHVVLHRTANRFKAGGQAHHNFIPNREVHILKVSCQLTFVYVIANVGFTRRNGYFYSRDVQVVRHKEIELPLVKS